MKIALVLLAAVAAGAQTFSQRGYLDFNGFFFPQSAANDSSHAVGEATLRYEASSKIGQALVLSGAIDARTDSHRYTRREFGLSYWGRGRLRPAFSVRRLNASYTRGKLALTFGKQLIRWGKTDVLNPTDRFAARDFLNVVENSFSGVTAARLTYGGKSDTIDLIYQPRLTPSRVPLLNQRWAVTPPGVRIIEQNPDFPGGGQYGARWNHIGRGAEYSFSFYDGFDHLPLYRASIIDFAPPTVRVQRYYPQMRMYGGDAAVPLPLVTVKAEAAYYTSSTSTADEYVLYVLQLERQAGEWSFIGGYAGQAITQHGAAISYSPVRGATRAFVAHAGYTIDTNRSVSVETVIRQNGRGAYVKPEYTQSLGQHWRVTAGFAVIRGSEGDFLGQYRRNSFGLFKLRYSF